MSVRSLTPRTRRRRAQEGPRHQLRAASRRVLDAGGHRLRSSERTNGSLRFGHRLRQDWARSAWLRLAHAGGACGQDARSSSPCWRLERGTHGHKPRRGADQNAGGRNSRAPSDFGDTRTRMRPAPSPASTPPAQGRSRPGKTRLRPCTVEPEALPAKRPASARSRSPGWGRSRIRSAKDSPRHAQGAARPAGSPRTRHAAGGSTIGLTTRSLAA